MRWKIIRHLHPIRWLAGFWFEHNKLPMPPSWTPYVLGVYLGSKPMKVED